MRIPMAQYVEVIEEIQGDFMEYAEELWRKGGEGIMIVKRDMKYVGGSRKAWDTLKIKKKLGHLDVQVVDILEPTKLYGGDYLDDWKYWISMEKMEFQGKDIWIKSGQTDDGYYQPDTETTKFIAVTKAYYYGWKTALEFTYKENKIRVASGLTDEDKAYLATDAAVQAVADGTLFAVVTGMEFTEDSIRHPVFIDFRHK